MHLNAANVAHFLMCRGLLSPDAIVAGDLAVLDASRRNRNTRRRVRAPNQRDARDAAERDTL
jgi:hypothetical protein